MSSSKKGFHTIGLTGGIASGKSVVAEWLRTKNIPVINLDELGRALTARPGPLWQELAKICGPEILLNQQLNRRLLQEQIFADAGLRKKVEAILHPVILAEFERQRAEAQSKGHKLVVCEAALLVESGQAQSMDELVVISAPSDTRKLRLIARDKLLAALVDQIFAAQVDDTARMASAHYVIKNEGSLEDLQAQTDRLVESWRTRGWI